MFTTIMGVISTVIQAAFGWFATLIDSMDTVGVIAGFLGATMVMIASYRFLLAPLMGGRSIASLRSRTDGVYPKDYNSDSWRADLHARNGF